VDIAAHSRMEWRCALARAWTRDFLAAARDCRDVWFSPGRLLHSSGRIPLEQVGVLRRQTLFLVSLDGLDVVTSEKEENMKLYIFQIVKGETVGWGPNIPITPVFADTGRVALGLFQDAFPEAEMDMEGLKVYECEGYRDVACVSIPVPGNEPRDGPYYRAVTVRMTVYEVKDGIPRALDDPWPG